MCSLGSTETRRPNDGPDPTRGGEALPPVIPISRHPALCRTRPYAATQTAWHRSWDFPLSKPFVINTSGVRRRNKNNPLSEQTAQAPQDALGAAALLKPELADQPGMAAPLQKGRSGPTFLNCGGHVTSSRRLGSARAREQVRAAHLPAATRGYPVRTYRSAADACAQWRKHPHLLLLYFPASGNSIAVPISSLHTQSSA